MSWSSQMSSEPRAFSAALYSFQLVVRYFGLLGALMPIVYPSRDSGAPRAFVQQSPINAMLNLKHEFRIPRSFEIQQNQLAIQCAACLTMRLEFRGNLLGGQ